MHCSEFRYLFGLREGRYDAVSGALLTPACPPIHIAADGSCASAALEDGGGGGAAALARPWLAASPLTGAPWKRARLDPYRE